MTATRRWAGFLGVLWVGLVLAAPAAAQPRIERLTVPASKRVRFDGGVMDWRPLRPAFFLIPGTARVEPVEDAATQEATPVELVLAQQRWLGAGERVTALRLHLERLRDALEGAPESRREELRLRHDVARVKLEAALTERDRQSRELLALLRAECERPTPAATWLWRGLLAREADGLDELEALDRFSAALGRFERGELAELPVEPAPLDHGEAIEALDRYVAEGDEPFVAQAAYLAAVLSPEGSDAQRTRLEAWVSRYPEHPWAGEVWFRLGDICSLDATTEANHCALRNYQEAARASKGRPLFTAALYRLGWAALLARQDDVAAEAFATDLIHGKNRPEIPRDELLALLGWLAERNPTAVEPTLAKLDNTSQARIRAIQAASGTSVVDATGLLQTALRLAPNAPEADQWRQDLERLAIPPTPATSAQSALRQLVRRSAPIWTRCLQLGWSGSTPPRAAQVTWTVQWDDGGQLVATIVGGPLEGEVAQCVADRTRRGALGPLPAGAADIRLVLEPAP